MQDGVGQGLIRQGLGGAGRWQGRGGRRRRKIPLITPSLDYSIPCQILC